jgi:carboxyl-terminal processing protease
MKKKLFIPILAIGILITGASFKSDFFEIAKQIEIFTTLFKELNMNYVDEVTPSILMDKAIKGMLVETIQGHILVLVLPLGLKRLK